MFIIRKSVSINTNFYFLALILLFSSCGDLARVKQGLAEETKNEVIKQLVPDKRDLIFEPELQFVGGDQILLSGYTENPQITDTLIQALNQLGFSVTDSVSILPKDKFEASKALVRLSVANVKAKPSHSSELVTQFLLGHRVRILDEQRGWYRVRGIDNYLGWIEKDAVYVLSNQEVLIWNNADKAMVNEELVAKTKNGDVAFDLTKGGVVMQGSRKNGLQEIILADGRRGWVPPKALIQIEEWQKNQIKQLQADLVLADAKELLGRPYVWGGTSMRGLDCSGFTKTVFLQNGWLLPRDASQQVKTGIEVASDSTEFMSLQPGDLLFFGRKESPTQKERIVHVGIALGNGRMIHCAGSVNIESLIAGEPDYNAYRAKSFVKAKRIIGLENEQGFNWLTEASFNL
jgi:SH3-like domain-containing protein